jgi:hypothetical protein
MVAEPAPDMRICALTSGSAAPACTSGAERARRRSTAGRGCARPPAGICGKYAAKFPAPGSRRHGSTGVVLRRRARPLSRRPRRSVSFRRRMRRTRPRAVKAADHWVPRRGQYSRAADTRSSQPALPQARWSALIGGTVAWSKPLPSTRCPVMNAGPVGGTDKAGYGAAAAPADQPSEGFPAEFNGARVAALLARDPGSGDAIWWAGLRPSARSWRVASPLADSRAGRA